MKIRQGFVSNSSSASFLIAVKKENLAEFKEDFLGPKPGKAGCCRAEIGDVGRKALIEWLDTRIEYQQKELNSRVTVFIQRIKQLYDERFEIMMYDPAYELLDVSFHDGYSDAGKILEEYIEEGEAIKIRRL